MKFTIAFAGEDNDVPLQQPEPKTEEPDKISYRRNHTSESNHEPKDVKHPVDFKSIGKDFKETPKHQEALKKIKKVI